MYFQGPIWRKASQQIIKILNSVPALPDSRLVIALSGGKDSVFLLAALSQLKKKYRFELLPVYVNHGIQPEAKLFGNIAENLSQKLNLKLESFGIRKQPKGRNLEDWLRFERYRVLERHRRQKNAEYIAVAHHQSDQAETVLAHIIRGTGLRGLRGMLPVRNKIIRPLLHTSKKDIECLIHSTDLPYYNDRLNYPSAYQRNKIRHDLIPYLEKEFNPQITARLSKLAENARRGAE